MTIQLQKLILIFIRIASFIVICPVISFRGLPNIAKVALATGLSAMIYSIIPEIETIESMFYFVILVLKESALGLAMGFATDIVFSTVQIAGQLVDFQVGFSMSTVYDPLSGMPASHYGKLFNWMAMCIFFILDLHHRIINTLINSFRYISVSTVDFARFDVESIVKLFGVVFETSLNLAAPMIIVILVTEIVLGVISKTVPQINVLILGMPLKAMVSFIMMLLILTWFTGAVGKVLSSIPSYLNKFVQSLI